MTLAQKNRLIDLAMTALTLTKLALAYYITT